MPSANARMLSGLQLWLLLLAIACPTIAAELRAGPDDYRDAVRRLRAGDVLRLAPGVYTHGLNVHRLEGAEGRPIVIRGADAPHRTVFVASPGRNTVSIVDSAHVTVSDLSLTGGQVPVDAVKAEGHARYAHHITLERLRIEGYDASQQNVAISTKCPAWNWVIRDNLIDGAGTGLYLGNSDGSAPFVRGVIENNVVVGTRGYAMQIKHQAAWPEVIGVVDEPGETVIRYNTFAKDARSSAAELARPNLLLGHWPLGAGGAPTGTWSMATCSWTIRPRRCCRPRATSPSTTTCSSIAMATPCSCASTTMSRVRWTCFETRSWLPAPGCFCGTPIHPPGNLSSRTRSSPRTWHLSHWISQT
ncbi:MAG: hypothetical protein IPG28_11335 [Betaproteobacteria bacterium]|nr:hypothetical protein [Betaproteobacteria bacterium]